MIYGVIRQINENAPFVFCMCETKGRAQSIADDPRIEDKYISKYWVEPIKDTALIGDYLEHVKV